MIERGILTEVERGRGVLEREREYPVESFSAIRNRAPLQGPASAHCCCETASTSIRNPKFGVRPVDFLSPVHSPAFATSRVMAPIRSWKPGSSKKKAAPMGAALL